MSLHLLSLGCIEQMKNSDRHYFYLFEGGTGLFLKQLEYSKLVNSNNVNSEREATHQQNQSKFGHKSAIFSLKFKIVEQ